MDELTTSIVDIDVPNEDKSKSNRHTSTTARRPG